jgi:hypothetical protein
MRADMHELLVERPRWAHRARYPRAFVRNRGGDDPCGREALSRSRYGDKELSENFAPLLRFLRSNVGRPWANVHSEMAKVLAPSNAVQRHVLVHLADFLVTSVYESEGTLWAARRRHGPEPLRATTRTALFYVHPRTKLLCMIERAKRKPARRHRLPNANVRELSPTKQLRRVGGIWYALTVAPFPAWPLRATCVDVISRRRVRWETYSLFPELQDLWESGRYTVARHQPGKRALAVLLQARS